MKFANLLTSALAIAAFAAMHAGSLPSTEKAKDTVVKAVAVLEPKDDSGVEGTVTFTTEHGGLRIVADVYNLTPGKHGFHVHEHGDCSAHDASSAGGHFNPHNKKHAGPDDPERHAGDMGNLVADASGHAHYDRVDDIMVLNGPDTIIDKSVIVHAGEDDLKSQPSGNAGARVACGVVEAE